MLSSPTQRLSTRRTVGQFGKRHACPATPFVGIWLEAPLPVLEARLAARNAAMPRTQRAKVLRASARVRTIPPHDWHILDATDPALLARAHDLVRKALSSPCSPC